jgi:hypothetical protein
VPDAAPPATDENMQVDAAPAVPAAAVPPPPAAPAVPWTYQRAIPTSSGVEMNEIAPAVPLFPFVELVA